MSDLFEHLEELERLAQEYDAKHGTGKAEEILSSLMLSHSTEDQIRVFQKANGREIIIEVNGDVLDSVVIKYK